MNKTPSLLLTALLTVTSAPVAAQNIAKVNGVAIPESRVEAMLRAAAAQGQQDSPQLRQRMRDELIMREIVAQEAGKLGLAKLPEVATQLELSRQGVLTQAYVQEYFKKNPVGDADVKAEYDKLRRELGDKEYRARHILVKSEEQAKDILVKLKGGGKFDDLAKQSEDPGSKDKGGDLDWVSPAGLVPEFSRAMVSLKKGDTFDAPVKTQFGFHVIRLDDVRDVRPPSIEQTRPRIIEALQRQKYEKMLAELRTRAKIE